MTVTATVDMTGKAPRIRVTVTSSGGAAITAISLTRTVQGSTVPVRAQPTAGPSPRTADDYEAAWSTLVTYTATYATSGGTTTETSSPVTVTSPYPYAIHPTTPALSLCLDRATPTVAGIRTIGAVTRAATDTAHRVLNSPYAVYTKTGPRSAPRLSLDYTTTTLLELQALIATVTDQTPLLIRFPPDWGWAWEDGYYRVGDVEENRVVQYGPDPSRTFTLPLERVDGPAGTQQAERTYGNVLNDFATYSAVRAAYASYTALLADTRS